MLTRSQNDLYFDRMASSLGDKINLVPFLVHGNVLDVGAGGGELAEYMRREQSSGDVHAIDGSTESVTRMKQNFPSVKSTQLMVDELLGHFGANSFDNIVCSSILHEVYSYGGYDIEKVYTALHDFYQMLRPCGRLIIRDGVMPTGHDEDVVLNFVDEDSNNEFHDFLLRYKEIAPFYGDEVAVKKYDNGKVLCDYRSAMELLYTYTWGMGSIEREALEVYGVMTQRDYVDSVQRAGFMDVVESRQYLQPEYVTHLGKKVNITDPIFGLPVSFPSSNMIIVAEK